MSVEKILIIDDDEDIRELITLNLKSNGFHVCAAADGAQALDLMTTYRPHLIILDVMMPGLDGFDVCLELRKQTDAPILFLSAKEDATDKIVGLRLGADDYVTKPFNMGELIARVRAHLRRYRLKCSQLSEDNANTTTVNILRYPGMEIDLNGCDVRVDGHLVPLSAKEYHLLSFLAQHPDQVYTLEQLFQTVWNTYSYGDQRTVMVHISNLRKKIEPDPSNPKYIVTVRGIGYKFNSLEHCAVLS